MRAASCLLPSRCSGRYCCWPYWSLASRVGGRRDRRASQAHSAARDGRSLHWRAWCAVGLAMVRACAGAGNGRKPADHLGNGDAGGAGTLPGQSLPLARDLETENFYQTAEMNTRTGEVNSDRRPGRHLQADRYACSRSSETHPARPGISGLGKLGGCAGCGSGAGGRNGSPHLPPNRHWTTVEFTDLRFGYSFLGPDSDRGKAALGGWVYIVDGKEDAGEAMNGREQK